MAGRIVVFGATGYTGRLVAQALVARGAQPVLAARDERRLEQLASELGGGAETAVADVSRPDLLRAMLDQDDVLVTTVGPFARLGDPAVEAAAATGATYLDSTGEPAFIRRVFERYGPQAKAAGATLVTAFGYDWVPGNLAAALALREAGGEATRVAIGYFARGGVEGSGGTRASAAGAVIEPAFAWRGGELVTERAAKRVASFEVDGRPREAVSVGSSEHFALPRLHPQLQEVDAYLGWFGGLSRPMQLFSAATSPVLRIPGVKAVVSAGIARAVKGSTGGPSEETLARMRSLVIAQAFADGRLLSEVRLEGVDGYTFTARVLAWGAARAAEHGVETTGAVGPVEAFGLDELVAGCAEAGLARV